jgi:hypothetical protein
MAKTYVPTLARDVHALAQYTTAHQSQIRLTLANLDESILDQYDLFYADLIAFDAFYGNMLPLEAGSPVQRS